MYILVVLRVIIKGKYIYTRAVFSKKKRLGGGGADTYHMAEGHCKGEGAGGECAPSCTEREAETTFILQSEWEGPL